MIMGTMPMTTTATIAPPNGFETFSEAVMTDNEFHQDEPTVPLGVTTLELLKNVSRTGKYVCCGIQINEMLSEATFRGFWDRMRFRTGIKELSAHDLRRGALTRAAIMGLSAFAIRDLAGHRSLAMANRYVQRAGNALRPSRMKSRNEWPRHSIQNKR
jgi:integrase